MQSNEKEIIDARAFPQVWESLSDTERNDLALEIYKRKCCTTRQTIHNWATGSITPMPIVRDAVAEAVTKVTGRKVVAKFLFPEA